VAGLQSQAEGRGYSSSLRFANPLLRGVFRVHMPQHRQLWPTVQPAVTPDSSSRTHALCLSSSHRLPGSYWHVERGQIYPMRKVRVPWRWLLNSGSEKERVHWKGNGAVIRCSLRSVSHAGTIVSACLIRSGSLADSRYLSSCLSLAHSHCLTRSHPVSLVHALFSSNVFHALFSTRTVLQTARVIQTVRVRLPLCVAFRRRLAREP
jgi:hypothetical protein